MPISLPWETFIQQPGIIFDVRSPSEYKQGHIPNSYSLPLFSDEERSLVGTTYKQKSQEAAIDLGLRLVGPKLYDFVQLSKPYLKEQPGKIVCWRGGMRSGFIARLFESIGFTTLTLQGGYRSFRRWTLKVLQDLSIHSPQLYLLGGLTGSGKTAILQHLKQLGEQVIDLEALANHRGSVFGMIGLPPQPSQEQFENTLAYQWSHLDLSRPIWLEDESRLIGHCCIPTPLYQLMSIAPVFFIENNKEQRLDRLLHLYGQMDSSKLMSATEKISRRLGGKTTQEILYFLNHDQKRAAFDLLLAYYDKAYLYKLHKRQVVYSHDKMPNSDWERAIYLKQEGANLLAQ